jgi:hypothetical protein
MSHSAAPQWAKDVFSAPEGRRNLDALVVARARNIDPLDVNEDPSGVVLLSLKEIHQKYVRVDPETILEEAPSIGPSAEVLDIIRRCEEKVRQVTLHEAQYAQEFIVSQAAQCLQMHGIPFDEKNIFGPRFLYALEKDQLMTDASAVDELSRMYHTVSRTCGEQWGTIVYFLYTLARGASDCKRSIQIVKKIVTMHEPPEPGEEPVFFRELLRGISDIQVLHDRLESLLVSSNKGLSEQSLERKSNTHAIFVGLLEDNELSRTRARDVRSCIGRVMDNQTTQMQNPFFHRSLKESPFREQGMQELMNRNCSPLHMAATLAYVNMTETYAVLRRHAEAIIADIDEQNGDVSAHVQERMRGLYDYAVTLPGADLFLPSLEFCTIETVDADESPQIIERLREWLGIDFLERAESHLVKECDIAMADIAPLLLAFIDSLRVVNDLQAQKLFLQFWSRINMHAIPPTSAWADFLSTILQRTDVHRVSRQAAGDKKHSDMGNDEDPRISQAAFFHVPLSLPHADSLHDQTLLEMMEEYVELQFPDPPHVPGTPTWRMILPCKRPESIADVKKLPRSFDGAISTPITDKGMWSTSNTLRNHWGTGTEGFDMARRYFETEAAAYFDAPDHTFVFFNGGLQAGTFLMHEFWRHRNQGCVIVCGSEEYKSMYQTVAGDATNLCKLCMVDVLGKKRKEKSPAKLAETFAAQVDKRTQFVLFSVGTRLGRSPCKNSADAATAILEFDRVFHEQIRAKGSDAILIMDACQSVGRLPLPPLHKLNPRTAVIATGTKGLDVGTGGILALSRDIALELRERLKEDQPPIPTEGAVPLNTGHHHDMTHIMALALRLRERRSRHRRSDEGISPGSSTESRYAGTPARPLQERISERLQFLTEHAIRSAEMHSGKIVSAASSFPAVQKMRAGSNPEDALSCKVFAPKSSEGGFGTLTVWFPTMPSAHMHHFLQNPPKGIRESFKTSGTPLDDSCLRIAFHQYHTPKDIDALFAAMADIHTEWLASNPQPVFHGISPYSSMRKRREG